MLFLWACISVSTILGKQLSSDADFKDYMKSYTRSYEVGSSEFIMRRQIFLQQQKEIQLQNSKNSSVRLWTAGLNSLADRTDAEYDSLHGLSRASSARQAQHQASSLFSELLENNVEVAESVDWTHLKSLQEIPNQGHCGSCWAVATASLLRAHVEIKRN